MGGKWELLDDAEGRVGNSAVNEDWSGLTVGELYCFCHSNWVHIDCAGSRALLCATVHSNSGGIALPRARITLLSH